MDAAGACGLCAIDRVCEPCQPDACTWQRASAGVCCPSVSWGDTKPLDLAAPLGKPPAGSARRGIGSAACEIPRQVTYSFAKHARRLVVRGPASRLARVGIYGNAV